VGVVDLGTETEIGYTKISIAIPKRNEEIPYSA
jgi:hypothetical protein